MGRLRPPRPGVCEVDYTRLSPDAAPPRAAEAGTQPQTHQGERPGFRDRGEVDQKGRPKRRVGRLAGVELPERHRGRLLADQLPAEVAARRVEPRLDVTDQRG